MNYFFYALFSLLLVGGTACNNTSSTADAPLSAEEQLEKDRWDEVMVIHDEVMPKMGDITRAQKALRALNEEQRDTTLMQQLIELEKAEEAMWAWMHELKPASERDTMAHQSYLNYLAEEKIKITEVQQMMLTSIQDAQTIIEAAGEKTENE